MAKDLRAYLGYLDRNHPDELLRVKKEVDPSWEIAALIRKLQAQERFPALLFERVKGSSLPVISNLFASRMRLAATFETGVDHTLKEYVSREAKTLPPKLIDRAPVKEVILAEDKADLSQLPIITHSEKDGGPYITAGIGLVKDPDTGVRNAGIYRLQYKGPHKLGIDLGAESHLAHILRKTEAKGQKLPIAIILGHHPAVYHGSQSRCPLNEDELEVMGGLLAESLEITNCETVELEVPAHAEIIIEGHIPPNLREEEGPFGEFTWYYGPVGLEPVIEVTGLTHRKDAIFHDIYSPYLDHNYCGVLGREANIFRRITDLMPGLNNVLMPEWGGCRLACVIQIEKEYDGQGKNAALAALAADPYIKIAVVVDGDLDIYSEREVMWAVVTRTQPDRDFFYIPESFVCGLSPSGYTVRSRNEKGGMDTKLGIDATKPLGVPFPERCEVREADWKRINLDDYDLN